MIALDAMRLVLADLELPWRDQLRLGLPAVGTVEPRVPAYPHPGNQALAGSSVTTAQLPVDEPPRSPIPSLPAPGLVGLFFRWCHISSSSTTTARPSAAGFACSLANGSIQFITEGMDTPSSFAVRFIPGSGPGQALAR